MTESKTETNKQCLCMNNIMLFLLINKFIILYQYSIWVYTHIHIWESIYHGTQCTWLLSGELKH